LLLRRGITVNSFVCNHCQLNLAGTCYTQPDHSSFSIFGSALLQYDTPS
jgi:hypothetical protein